MRSFDVPQTKATHVRLRVLTNQCTGGPAYQGDQDNDPGNSTDCDETTLPGFNVNADARSRRRAAGLRAVTQVRRGLLSRVPSGRRGRVRRMHTIELTDDELRLLHAALHSYRDDFGHEEADVLRRIKDLLAKLPAEPAAG